MISKCYEQLKINIMVIVYNYCLIITCNFLIYMDIYKIIKLFCG